tara:strand:- start:11 stop:223 length:213 start_codon:yes stop_codon:yes gene_type:complete
MLRSKEIEIFKMKKTILKDDNGKSLEVDLKEFLDHLNEYHNAGISTHTQNGCSFRVDDAFRMKIKKLGKY